MRKVFKWLFRIFAFLLFILGVSLAHSFVNGIVSHEILVIGIAAFFGAFFAFFFDRLAERLTNFRKGASKHFSALVDIERLLNRIMAQLDKNIRLGRDDIEALNSMKMVVWNLPPIPINFELANDLKNIDFVNDYFSYTMEIESLNRDLGVMMSAYNEAKTAFLNRTLSAESFEANAIFTSKKLSEIIRFIESYQLKTSQLLATTRVLLRERDQKVLLLGALPKLNYLKDMSNQVNAELSILKSEIEQEIKNSQADIDKIKGTMK